MNQSSIQRIRDPKPNEQQQQAIENLSDHLLVSAGAGSGKTWVLTERYLEMLVNGAAPRQIVAITFTELAAAEMKGRIRSAVQRMIDETPDLRQKAHWRRMYNELDGAVISTIHGFCMRLLKEYPVEAAIDPTADVLSPDEADRLLLQAVIEVTEQWMRERTADIQAFYLAWGGRRGIIHSLLDAYLAMVTFDYPVSDMLRDTERMLADLRRQIPVVIEQIDRLVDTVIAPEAAAQMGGKKKPAQYVLDMAAWIDKWREKSALLREWDGTIQPEVRQTLYDLHKSMWANRGGGESVKEAHKMLKEECLPRLASLETAPDTVEQARLFGELLSAIDGRYSEAKSERHKLDFHDLERLTARMLERHPEVAEEYSRKLKYIMVDEFQDTNRLQKTIIDRIAEDDGQIRKFFVGDGKQSIYKFRGADVDIFQETETRYKRIQMTKNFRTQAGVIHYINDFFGWLMDGAEAGEVRQVRFESLDPHRNPEHQQPCVEFLVERNDAAEDAREAEADLIARRILELVKGDRVAVYKKKSGESVESPHPVRYGDIAMLFSATTQLAVYEEALQRYGIPYVVEKGRQFYKKREIADMLSWLKAIVDASDQVALAALLRSPVFALSDETLFWLAQKGAFAGETVQKSPLAQELEPQGALSKGLACVWREAASDGQRVELQALLGEQELAKTLTAFEQLGKWRTICERQPLADFMREILAESGYLQVVLAGFGGEQKYANLFKLIEMAEELQRTEGYGISEFVDYLQRMQDEGVQETEAQLGSSSLLGGAVRIMTVHASKGLEFPVVILPDLKRSLKTGDATCFIIRPGQGIGLKRAPSFDEANESKLEMQGDGLFRLLRQQEKQRELFEEHRKLYVAMTRARDYLILPVTRPRIEGPSWQKWILQHAGFDKFDDLTFGVWEKENAADRALYRIEINGEVAKMDADFSNRGKKRYQQLQERLGQRSGGRAAAATGTGIDSATAGSFGLLFPVGRLDAPQLPMISASAVMTHRTCARRFYLRYLFQLPEWRGEDTAQRLSEEEARLPDTEETLVSELPDERAEWQTAGFWPGEADQAKAAGELISQHSGRSKRVHADLRGTLVHQLFEQLRQSSQKQELIEAVLRSAGVDRQAKTELIPYLEEMADRYLQSRWFQSESFREQSFHIKIGPAIVHGFIDAIITEADGTLTVVDFKTNDIKDQQHVAELTERYTVQLQLYALAAEAVFQKTVGQAVLFFLAGNTSVPVDVSRPTLTRLRGELERLFVRFADDGKMESYPMTEQRDSCGRCGYRVLCGR